MVGYKSSVIWSDALLVIRVKTFDFTGVKKFSNVGSKLTLEEEESVNLVL